MPLSTWGLVFIGGGLGSMCRFALSVYNQNIWAWGTLIANSLSCLILGFCAYLIAQAALPKSFAYFVVVGFCGGFSTFSTFSNELFNLLRADQFQPAVIYLSLSLGIGLVGILAGLYLAKLCFY